MKREIKFRAWHKGLNEMLPNVQYYIGSDGWAFGQLLYSDCAEVMQFTGLKDKKGREIYEGDIVKLDDVICPITWDDGGFQMITDKQHGKSPALQGRLKHFEVIGNIYENSELLVKE